MSSISSTSLILLIFTVLIWYRSSFYRFFSYLYTKTPFYDKKFHEKQLYSNLSNFSKKKYVPIISDPKYLEFTTNKISTNDDNNSYSVNLNNIIPTNPKITDYNIYQKIKSKKINEHIQTPLLFKLNNNILFIQKQSPNKCWIYER